MTAGEAIAPDSTALRTAANPSMTRAVRAVPVMVKGTVIFSKAHAVNSRD
jgi:hypothetical protein